jgi:hypothetical protein
MDLVNFRRVFQSVVEATRMFSVKWVYRRQEDEAILVEEGYIVPLDKVVSLCKRRSPVLRLDFPDTPPDGFIVMDSEGREVRRWYAPEEAH